MNKKPTMKDGVETSKRLFSKLSKEQQSKLLEITGGRLWFVKSGWLVTLFTDYTVRQTNRIQFVLYKNICEDIDYRRELSKSDDDFFSAMNEKIKKLF